MGITLNQLTNVTQKLVNKIKDKYVTKEEGKGLSSNDYTTEEKEKVAKIDTIEEDLNNLNLLINKNITNISAVEGNLQLTTDSYQVVTLSSNTTLVLPNVTKPIDIVVEIKPSANITLTYPNGVKWQGDEPSILSTNIYEIYLGFDGTDWIGGWITYEPIS